jgi:hypothetical protein
MARDQGPSRVRYPHRVIFLGASYDGWFKADAEERAAALRAMKELFAEWIEFGACPLATLDDDLFMVGPPGSPRFTWYLMYEIPSIEIVAQMIHGVRIDRDGVRLDRYMRLEARIGRPFGLIEQA